MTRLDDSAYPVLRVLPDLPTHGADQTWLERAQEAYFAVLPGFEFVHAHHHDHHHDHADHAEIDGHAGTAEEAGVGASTPANGDGEAPPKASGVAGGVGRDDAMAESGPQALVSLWKVQRRMVTLRSVGERIELGARLRRSLAWIEGPACDADGVRTCAALLRQRASELEAAHEAAAARPPRLRARPTRRTA